MSLTITATIVDPAGKALLQLAAQVCLFTATGDPKILASGATDKGGKLVLSTRFVVGEYQPRLQLQLLRGEKFVEVSEDPLTFTDAACDFGTIRFDPGGLQPVDDGLAPRGGDFETERAALVKEMETQFSATLAQALATRTSELTADKSAALAAQAQQLAADKSAALAAKSQELNAARDAALAARTQELTAARDAALAKRTQELAGEKAVALAAQAQQHAQALAAKEAALAAEAARVADLQQQLAAGDAPHESSIEDLAQTTASQIQRVQQSLREDRSGLQLGRVSLQLKVLPGKSGGRVALPQAKDIEKVGAGALGSLDLAFLPDPSAARARPAPVAPRVLGYTEALARRKLAERGLAVEVVHQLVSSAADHGRVVLQKPAPKAPVAEGAAVLIAIGRKEEHDPRPS